MGENFPEKGKTREKQVPPYACPQPNVPAYVIGVANAYKGEEAMVPHYFYLAACCDCNIDAT
ncbi:hypothetical protein PYH37_005030 [Sinorhizobium numidicum]|uniref:Uncharacterized protein n=1 Tax=Sinorhizobium numidicum TaxID=680248 RepID=A0ABY8CZQ5_9HYPH|nr:hypothetical protein [Sinorhizobium numidicum]WEX76706.1 hypothetical protein PYH37_005030 [Sinorhizobium numidicum]WEX83367.1 hypothetical protein PYH38_005742 [Sinorhizobium numidicum]